VKTTRVVLADDHTVIRKGLRLVVERQPDLIVVGEAADGHEAVEVAARENADVVVMDITMARLNGIDATARITAKQPAAGVVILSMHSDESYVLRALRAGARAYLLKDSAEGDLIAAIRAISAGKSFFSPKVSRLLKEDYVRRLQEEDAEDSYDLLTAREREILQLIAEGKSNKEIAGLLFLSLYTVETHRGNILEKLGLHGTADVILYAVRKGIVSG
jgi:two-component system, NarL family, response regulator NreC